MTGDWVEELTFGKAVDALNRLPERVQPRGRCHEKPFTTLRNAKRRAWLIADGGKLVEPYECDTGHGWHLRAVE